MPQIQSNGIQIECETSGDRERGRPLILLRGLGTQMIQWHPDFRRALVDRGHFLVVFDNRDVGRSTWFDETGIPEIPEILASLQRGEVPKTPYTLEDMCDDVAGLMGALDLESAHIAGMSMGGMLTTVFGARHPDRVRSLVPVMASTGNPALPGPTLEAARALLEPAPTDREAFIPHWVRTTRVFSSPGYPPDPDALTEMAGRVYDRAFHPAGTARQYAAIVASGDRRDALRAITAPTLVIHGVDDPLVPVEGGRDIAATIPGADLLEIPGMGHDLPKALFEQLADAIATHTERAEAMRADAEARR